MESQLEALDSPPSVGPPTGSLSLCPSARDLSQSFEDETVRTSEELITDHSTPEKYKIHQYEDRQLVIRLVRVR
jgi:hypothetical protein